MKKLAITEQNQDEIHRLIKRIPFFSSVLNECPEQFDRLLDLADIIEVDAGETVIRKGDTDMYLFFLLKGQLTVFLDDDPYSSRVNYISPGELFGMLSMITHTPRSAMIKADENAKSILLFQLNFAYINDDSPSSELSLQTKILFYRMAAHHVRWTLEQKKMAHPRHPLVSEMLKLPLPKAPKGTAEELSALKQQTKRLSELLFMWNEYDMEKGPGTVS